MPVVDFLRHGETTMHGCLNGRHDPPLSDTGWDQIRRQYQGRAWSTVVTSPAMRAHAAASEIAALTAVTLRPDERWWEMDYGDWDGKTFKELRADRATCDALNRFSEDPHAVTPPNGESWQVFSDRIEAALTPLEDETLVVCHAGVIRAALNLTCGLPLDMLWRMRIGYAARVRLSFGKDDHGAWWGEIVELEQS